MPLDVVTITFVGGVMTFSTGLFLVGYWFYDSTAKSALWWAASNSGAGIGIVLLALAAVLPLAMSNVVAPLMLAISAVLTLVASRIFNRQSVTLLRVVLAMVVWFGIGAMVANTIGEQYSEALGEAVAAALNAAAAYTFWLARAERLSARTAVIIVLGVHAAALFLFSIQSAFAVDYSILPSINWLGIIHFVGLGYAVGMTILLIMMFNQRREAKYLADASVDPLTGLFNRRGVLNRAQRVLDRVRLDGAAVALLAFDLDRFKAVNDVFGHATGDKVLVLFADVLLALLRPADIAGRLGGEEFVGVIAVPTLEAAMSVANRVRTTFQAAAGIVDGQHVGATVSVGVAFAVATLETEPAGFAALLMSADRALYRAKQTGRNRVVLASSEAPTFDVTKMGLIA